MQEMERIEQEGKASQEELDALAQELSGKMLLTTWKATRWEVINVSSDSRIQFGIPLIGPGAWCRCG